MLLPRPRLHLVFFTSLLTLTSLWRVATSLETTLTVNLTDEAPRDAVLIAPEVCAVTFIPPDDYIYASNDPMCLTVDGITECTFDRSEYVPSLTVDFVSESEGSENFTFSISFDPTMVASCSDYIPNVNFTGQESDSVTLSCTPVFSCNSTFSDSTSSEVQWWRFANDSVRNDFLEDDDKSSFKNPHLVMTREGISTVSNTSLELMFTAATHEIVGYYATTLTLSGQRVNSQTFIVYTGPVLDDSSEDVDVVFGTSAASDFRKFFCRFVSFPPANVTWESPSGSDFTMIDTGEALNISSDVDPTLSPNGQLVFEKVQYSDSGEYMCTATNEVSGDVASDTFILRVRDPLRPLWPALGIIGSFLVTALFISGGALVDRVRGKKGVDDDDGSFQRNYSIVSNLGDDSSGNGSKRSRKHQSAGKRISITQQELLANASDPN